jgi:hypothetical protein
MYRTLALWLKRNPASIEADGSESNQDTLIAYVDAGTELYRLTQQSMSTSQTRTLVENLYLCIRHSDGPGYGGDVANLSILQAKAFDLLKSVRSDTPSTLVVVAAKLVSLHHDTAGEVSNDGPTYIAIASEAIEWVQALVLAHIADEELLETGAFLSVVQNLRGLIEEKYTFKLEHKGLPLWRRATMAALALSKPLLEQCQSSQLDRSVKVSIWTEFVQIAGGIVKAKGLAFVGDEIQIYKDQLADIDSFKTLRQVLIPHLGDTDLPDNVRLAYTQSLFEASIIHPLESSETPELETAPLKSVGKIRRGRVKRVSVSQRERMCYECFTELISLASMSDQSIQEKKLAQAAAPLLILRLAIPIRAYIADQPLRGRRPQPLSELEELLYCFDAVKKLECDPEALSTDSLPAKGIGQKAHLQYLYPLLVKAVGTAGDRWSGADEVLVPLQAVIESITPVP